LSSYVAASTSRAAERDWRERATTIARKLNKAGCFIRQIELCDALAEVVIMRVR